MESAAGPEAATAAESTDESVVRRLYRFLNARGLRNRLSK